VVDLGTLADVTFDAVIFDLDGTLIDSTPAVSRSWSVWAEEHGVAPDQLAGQHGVPAAGVVRAVLPAHRHTAATTRINELELADLSDIAVLPGAAEALADLVDGKNAIATSCTVALAKARIAAAELTPPSVLVTADDVEHGKPAPDPYLEAAARLAVDPGRCLVVEDAPKGLEAARAAGCRTLALITTTSRDELQADAVVANLADVRFVVEDVGIRVQLRWPTRQPDVPQRQKIEGHVDLGTKSRSAVETAEEP
jgi:sugar-phosphatase